MKQNNKAHGFILALLAAAIVIGTCNTSYAIESLPPGIDLYCTELGYTFINSECVFPDDTSCEGWSFYRGECGEQWSYCEQHGGDLQHILDDVGWTASYGVCVFSDGSECQEQDYMDGTCKPSECIKWRLSMGGCVQSNIPCPAEQVLGEHNPALESLRSFRNRTLAQSAIGGKIIQLYYRNADSINTALDRSPALRALTRKILEAIASKKSPFSGMGDTGGFL